MDDTTWEQGKLLAFVASALGVLKWLVGKSRVAAVDDKYDKRFDEFERKMELALTEHRRIIRKEIDAFEERLKERQEHNEQNSEEFRRRVLSTVDDLTVNLQSLRRAFVGGAPPERTSRLT